MCRACSSGKAVSAEDRPETDGGNITSGAICKDDDTVTRLRTKHGGHSVHTNEADGYTRSGVTLFTGV